MSDELMPQNNIPKVNDDEYTTRALNALEKAVPDTIDMMGEAVVDYTKNCMAEASRLQHGLAEMQRKLVDEDWESMNNDQRITLYSVETAAANERTGKILSPTFGMVSSKYTAQANAALAAQKSGVNIAIGNVGNARDEQMAKSLDPGVIKNQYDAYLLINALKEAIAEKKADANKVEETTENPENK